MKTIPLSVKGVTARQIMSAAPKITLLRSKGVKVTNLKVRLSDNGAEYYARTKTVVDEHGQKITRSKTYISSVTLKDPKTRYVLIDCTCPAHPFWGTEYGMNKRNAAQILRSNGEAPLVRDPNYRNVACKHVLSLLKILIQQRRV